MMAPYRLPLFTCLHAKLPRGIGVVALAEREQNRSWPGWDDPPFPTAVLRARPIRLAQERFLHLPLGVGRGLARWQPETVVVGGWDAPAYWATAAWARRTRTPLLLWSGTHAGTTRGTASVAKRALVRAASGFLAYSRAAADYLVSLGAPARAVAVVGNPVDTHAIAARSLAFASSEEGIQLAGGMRRPIVAYVGQLIPRKNVLALAEALRRIAFSGTLLVAGAGPLEADMRAATTELDARFLGDLPPERVQELLGIVDCVVLPSREEVWGLVVNEALAAGAYCVVSSRAGAVDLIQSDDLGVVVEPGVQELVAALPHALESVGGRTARSEAAHVLGGIAATADSIAAALAAVR